MTDPKAVSAEPKTLVERLIEEHEDGWSGPESGTLALEAAAALASLVADQAEYETMLAALNQKLDALAPHGTCGCSYDQPDDLCDHHSPRVKALVAERDAALALIDKDGKPETMARIIMQNIENKGRAESAEAERDALREALDQVATMAEGVIQMHDPGALAMRGREALDRTIAFVTAATHELNDIADRARRALAAARTLSVEPK